MSEKMGNNRLELANLEDRQVDAFHDINEMVIRFNKNHPCDVLCINR